MMDINSTLGSGPPPDIIDFAKGHPSEDLLPVDLLRTAADGYFDSALPEDLNYGKRQGDPRFLETLAEFLSRGYGATATADGLFVTAGNSQALDLACTQFTDYGDTIFVEEPTYSRTYRIFSDHGLNLVGIPLYEGGIDLDVLETELARARPKFVYTIPTCHNPGGQTLSASGRRRLIELSQEHDFLIVADEVYHFLSYFAKSPAAFGSMADGDTVLSLGSFSKILAPGLRLGWIQSSPRLTDRLLENGALCSGGSLNHFTSLVVGHAIEMGLLEAHILRLCDAYRHRLETMDAALHEHLNERASWRRPDGGYFFWLQLAGVLHAADLLPKAEQRGVHFDPGEDFSCCGGLRDHLRLSFARYDDAVIREGIARLGAALAE